MVASWSHVVGQNIMVVGTQDRRALPDRKKGTRGGKGTGIRGGEGVGQGYTLLVIHPLDPLPLARSHLVKFPQKSTIN